MCEDDDNENSTDGRVPALIVRHVRNEIFIVRFVDCTELRVDFDKTKVWRANKDVGEATRRKLVSVPIFAVQVRIDWEKAKQQGRRKRHTFQRFGLPYSERADRSLVLLVLREFFARLSEKTHSASIATL